MSARFVKSPGAALRVKAEAMPWLQSVAVTLAKEIEANVRSSNVGYLGSPSNYRITTGVTTSGPRISIQSSFWHWIEYGTAKSAAHHPIGRTMVQPGIEWRDAK